MKASAAKKDVRAVPTRRAILKILPQLLKDDVGFRAQLAGLLAENLTTREETQKLLEEIKLLREDANKRFEAADRRHEEMRAEANARFEAADRKYEEMRADSNARFEAVIKEMRDGFTRIDQRFLDMKNWMTSLGSRWGDEAEESFRNFMKALVEKEYGGKVEKWEHIQGEGKDKKHYEIDVVVNDGRTLLVEIKSSLSRGDIYHFAEQCDAYEQLTGVKASRRIAMTVYPRPAALVAAQDRGIEIVTR